MLKDSKKSTVCELEALREVRERKKLLLGMLKEALGQRGPCLDPAKMSEICRQISCNNKQHSLMAYM